MLDDVTNQETNLLGKIKDIAEFEDGNCVKVGCDLNGNAMYFSREAIPTRYKVSNISMGKQVCIIPFRRDCLLEYTKLAPTPLEILESVNMMRILEHGMKILMVPTLHDTQAVDTPADLEKVAGLMQDMYA